MMFRIILKKFRELCASGFLCLRWQAARDSVGQSDVEAIMALRRIGQESFHFTRSGGRQTSRDALLALIDWAPSDQALSSLYKAPKGEKAWPPLAMFKALLLATRS